MRYSAGLLLFAAQALSPSSDAESNHYEPLNFLVGHCWKGTFPGGKQTDEHCFSAVYGGKFLRDRHTLHESGQSDSFGETIYFWNSTARRIEYLYIESNAGYSQGVVSTETDALVFPATTYVENGKTQTYRSRWQRTGARAYDVVTEFSTAKGWVPGFKVHMERL